MPYFGFFNSPVSIPNVFDTTPCLEHLMEYEDCVIDVGSNKKQLLMPSWPTLYPGLIDGKTNIAMDARPRDMSFVDGFTKDELANHKGLTQRQQQLLYECEEERMVFKACTRELIALRRSPKMTSWDTCEAANMGFD